MVQNKKVTIYAAVSVMVLNGILIAGNVVAWANRWSNVGSDVEVHSFEIDTTTTTLPDDMSGLVTNYEIPTSYSPKGISKTRTDSLFVLLYNDDSNEGWMRSFYVHPTTGAIDRAALDSLQFTEYIYNNVTGFVHVKNNIYAGCWRGKDNDGWLFTLTVEDAYTEGWNHKFNNINPTSISKINNVSRSSINKVNGVE